MSLPTPADPAGNPTPTLDSEDAVLEAELAEHHSEAPSEPPRAPNETPKNVPQPEKIEQAPIASTAAPKEGDTPPAPEAGIPILPSVNEQNPGSSQKEGADADPAAKTGKRRRNRRRGKGGDKGLGKPVAEVSGSHPLFLKTLQGATPQERLRVIACLNELAGMVASA